MDKGIGFNRNIYRPWLDATAAFCGETDDLIEVRTRLDPVVGQDIKSDENRRKAIDILINIWGKSADHVPDLHREALDHFQATADVDDRLWLHHGMTLLTYPFFREVAASIGQLGRREDSITPAMVKHRLIAERGELGSLDKAVERAIFSLRNWGLLAPAGQRYAFTPRYRALSTDRKGLQSWMLAVALHAHPGEELPFADLVRLPELFPFTFSVRIDDLRQESRFAVERTAGGWDMNPDH